MAVVLLIAWLSLTIRPQPNNNNNNNEFLNRMALQYMRTVIKGVLILKVEFPPLSRLEIHLQIHQVKYNLRVFLKSPVTPESKNKTRSSFPVDFKVVRPPHVLLTARVRCHWSSALTSKGRP